MKFSVLLLLLVIGQIGVLCQSRPADLVVINARVRTMESPNSVVEAFAVSGHRITKVGTNKLMGPLIGPATRIIDAKGRLVLPGFNDAHVHFMAIGNTFSSINLRDASSAGEIAERLARHARFLPVGRWILGGHFKNDISPDKASIDAIAPGNPVFLYRADATVAFANAGALALAGVKPDDADLERNSNGIVTGIIRNAALKKVVSAVPKNHTGNWPEIGETATNYAASLGVTSVQDVHSDDSREVYRELHRRGKLKTRVYDCLTLRDRETLKASRVQAQRGGMVADGCVKSFSDGDEESKATLLRDVVAADKSGLQVMIHAIGNAANRIVLDVFEQTAKTNGRRDRRFRVEHAHNATESDLSRFGRLKILASMQPFLFEGSSGSRYGTLLRQNARVAFGSDASMVDLNPMYGIHAAVNALGESISVYEAVRAYTVTAAYAQFQEKEKGTIEPGKLADFVILSDDIFTIDRQKIRDAKVELTVVDGKVVYQTE